MKTAAVNRFRAVCDIVSSEVRVRVGVKVGARFSLKQ